MVAINWEEWSVEDWGTVFEEESGYSIVIFDDPEVDELRARIVAPDETIAAWIYIDGMEEEALMELALERLDEIIGDVDEPFKPTPGCRGVAVVERSIESRRDVEGNLVCKYLKVVGYDLSGTAIAEFEEIVA